VSVQSRAATAGLAVPAGASLLSAKTYPEERGPAARRSFEAARRRVSACAPAQGHLAEVEAQLDEIDARTGRVV